MDPRVHWTLRFGIPLLTLFNIAMFAFSNASIGAQVFLTFTLSDSRTLHTDSLFNFGLINSIVDMWKAGVWPLSVIVALFSGIWPYVKLVMMVIAWVAPLSYVPDKHRERILMVLDALGKWSMLDTYIMVLMLVSFHVHVDLPLGDPSRIANPIAVDVFVNAAFGFLTFMLATVLSLVLSHVILAVHRHLKTRKDENEGVNAQEWRALFTFFNPKRYPVLTRISVAVSLIVALVLVVVGTSIFSFRFHFFGLAGWALGLLGVQTDRSYSVFSVGTAVADSVQTVTGTIVITQIIFIFTAAILPILHLVALIVLWLVPLTRRIQKYLYVTCEVLYAWASLDVFVLSIIAAILQIGQFAGFMVGDRCALIDPIAAAFLSRPLDGHTDCFVVQSTLEPGCWVMFSAVIIYTIACMIVMRVCRHSLEQRQAGGATKPASVGMEEVKQS
jgi:hypothetical protein